MPSPRPRNTRLQPKWIEPKFAAITAFVIVLIVYGSLFPFRFQHHAGVSGPLVSLFATWRVPASRSDNISNVLLYVPFGLFALRAVLRLSLPLRILLITLAGCFLSIAIETVQFYVVGRDQGMADVYTNTAGTLFGAIAGAMLRRPVRLPLIGAVAWHPFVFLLLASWLGFRLFPYIPSTDPQKFWHALKPLVFAPALSLPDLYRQTAAWLLIALLLESLLGIARSRMVMALAVPILLLARATVVGTTLSPAETGGSVLGAVIWIGVLSRSPIRAVLIAILFCGGVVIQALDPFKFSSTSHPFGWIPFRSFLGASREGAVPVFFEKVFTYAGLVWLLARAGCRLSIATALGGTLVLSLRFTQIYLPGRSAEITDVTMLLILALVMKLLGDVPQPVTFKPAPVSPLQK